MPLSTYQRQMAGFLLHRHDEGVLRRCLHSDETAARTSTRLAVYRNNFMYSLVAALRGQFPVTERLVGPDFFGALARDFICEYPPREAALTLYGQELPAFIADHPECHALPWLGDVTHLEWLCQHALHAPEGQPLQIHELLVLPPERLAECVLITQPSVHLFSSRWPVQRIRAEHQKPDPEPLWLDSDASVWLLVYRLCNEVVVVDLQAPVFRLLQHLQSGQALQEAWMQTQSQFALPDEELTPMLVYLLCLQIFQQ